MSKNKFRHESMKPEQFDNDDFTMKIFEYSKSIFQLMIVVNGSVVAALFAKDFSLCRETIGIVFSGIIFSFIFKSLGIASLFGYARSERKDSFSMAVGMFLEALSILCLSISLYWSVRFLPM